MEFVGVGWSLMEFEPCFKVYNLVSYFSHRPVSWGISERGLCLFSRGLRSMGENSMEHVLEIGRFLSKLTDEVVRLIVDLASILHFKKTELYFDTNHCRPSCWVSCWERFCKWVLTRNVGSARITVETLGVLITQTTISKSLFKLHGLKRSVVVTLLIIFAVFTFFNLSCLLTVQK